ncbi:hypothetical protein AVEN_264307-1 [Araneus ventricosus]|uniref:Uncharacterized protein n=1 Tax=Araneus ventricosus TaxID=182803 RepID=A0A4Y2E465_ARAVE|nr:hypothetical protein AVEN_264307-1 [Araneus ventricosus]
MVPTRPRPSSVQHYIRDTFQQQVIVYGGCVEWHPRAPDLNPLDFFLWGYVKQRVRSRGGQVIRMRLRGQRAPDRNPIPPKIRRVCGPTARQITNSGPNALPLAWCGTLERECQLTSSCDRGSRSVPN